MHELHDGFGCPVIIAEPVFLQRVKSRTGNFNYVSQSIMVHTPAVRGVNLRKAIDLIRLYQVMNKFDGV